MNRNELAKNLDSTLERNTKFVISTGHDVPMECAQDLLTRMGITTEYVWFYWDGNNNPPLYVPVVKDNDMKYIGALCRLVGAWSNSLVTGETSEYPLMDTDDAILSDDSINNDDLSILIITEDYALM